MRVDLLDMSAAMGRQERKHIFLWIAVAHWRLPAPSYDLAESALHRVISDFSRRHDGESPKWLHIHY